MEISAVEIGGAEAKIGARNTTATRRTGKDAIGYKLNLPYPLVKAFQPHKVAVCQDRQSATKISKFCTTTFSQSTSVNN
jgi:hypothetical protein